MTFQTPKTKLTLPIMERSKKRKVKNG